MAPESRPPESRRFRAALPTTLGFGVALCIACCIVWFVVPYAGPDASGWLLVAMIVAAAAGFLAMPLRWRSRSAWGLLHIATGQHAR
ncbi:hypothetical protein [Mycetocola miduiensis]|uniref:hypothetical protein n=1 Tax=Mycetocola miduiensis TaxID=995034 RepID=UPI000B879754|nr:hypothetical protein [Mycetocola miduiensis]